MEDKQKAKFSSKHSVSTFKISNKNLKKKLLMENQIIMINSQTCIVEEHHIWRRKVRFTAVKSLKTLAGISCWRTRMYQRRRRKCIRIISIWNKAMRDQVNMYLLLIRWLVVPFRLSQVTQLRTKLKFWRITNINFQTQLPKDKFQLPKSSLRNKKK